MTRRLDTLRTIEAPEGVELALRVAGPCPRLIAFVLDFLLRVAAYSVIAIAARLLGGIGVAVYLLAFFFGEWLYPVVCEVKFRGATPGKRAVGLRVLRDDGTPVGWGESALRNVLTFVDVFPFGIFGLLSTLTSADFKRVGDRVAGTVVVHVDERARAPRLAKAEPVPPPVALQLEDQAALVEFAVRAQGWSSERAIEVGDRLAPVSGASGLDGVQRLFGIAQWIEGAR